MQEKKGPGRPKGTKKDGEKSPQKKLANLKTKVWAHTCANYLALVRGDENPLSAYMLFKRANQFRDSKRTNDDDPDTSFDSAYWSRRLRGLEGTLPKTVNQLWPEVKDAYFIGPWVGESPGTATGKGGFVPLWVAIGDNPNNIFNAWKTITNSSWDAWASSCLNNVSAQSDDFKKHIPFAFKNITSLRQFLTYISRSKQAPPLLSLTATLSVSRIDKDKEILLFDPLPKPDNTLNSLHSFRRAAVISALTESQIRLEEIINIAASYGLHIRDCGAITFQEYKNLKGFNFTETPLFNNFLESKTGLFIPVTDSAGHYLGPKEVSSEEEWRDIFGTNQ